MQGDKCGAKTRPGTPCARPAGWGTDHNGWGRCSYHGGKTESGTKAAEKQEQSHIAEQAITRYGLPRTVDPATALLEEVYRSAGTVAYLDSVVATFKQAELVNGSGDGPSVWVRMLNDERKHLAQVSRSTVDAKIAERHVRVAEVVGGHLVVFVRALLTDLGRALADGQIDSLDPDNPVVRELVSQQFRALPA